MALGIFGFFALLALVLAVIHGVQGIETVDVTVLAWQFDMSPTGLVLFLLGAGAVLSLMAAAIAVVGRRGRVAG
jgi:uncharacterized integral membrane protein